MLILDVEDTSDASDDVAKNIELREKEIFDMIKNDTTGIPTNVCENRNLFTSLELKMYLAGENPNAEKVNLDNSKPETETLLKDAETRYVL